MKPNWQ
ncbi:hypothetical protein CGLO_17804 [Colletotrichum gloeosporioides Cg-14]|nr:hypothetical protein CGLO_17804 [Colletotrichum gloeosporioides Cg-14]